MALRREGIIAGSELVAQIRIASKDLLSISNDITSSLNGNSNFQAFRQGTEKGNAIYENLITCINTITDKLIPTIDKITETTSNLFDEQENFNKSDYIEYKNEEERR